MKVLQVNNYHYPRGGSDSYFLDVTRLLQESGHEVKTFSTDRPENIEPSWYAVDPVKGVDTGKAGDLRNLLDFLYSSSVRRSMSRALGTYSPDIAHLHIYYGQLTASILKPLHDSGVPIVQSLHEYKLVCPTHGLYANGHFCDACMGRYYWNSILQRCNRGSLPRSALSMVEAYVSEFLGARSLVNRFIAVSDFQKQQLVRLGISEDKLTVLYHFAHQVSKPHKKAGEYFLFVGRVIKEKGIGVLLDAYAALGERAPMLKIAGAGNDLEILQSHAESLGIAPRVEWLGHKSGDDLNEVYENCLALINPSLLNETFGLTCLEALSHGRPVIASRIGAIPEVVTDGQSGLLVQPGSKESLANAMELLMHNLDRANEMGKAGIRDVEERFSKQVHYEKLKVIYNEVLQ